MSAVFVLSVVSLTQILYICFAKILKLLLVILIVKVHGECSFISQSVLRQVHIVLQREFSTSARSSPSSFNFQYLRFFLRSSSSCLPLLPHPPVTSILPSIFLSITLGDEGSSYTSCDQFSQPSFFSIICTIFLSSISHTIGPTDLLHPLCIQSTYIHNFIYLCT